MAIENSVSNDFLSMFVDSINVFDCRLSSVFMTKLDFTQSVFLNFAFLFNCTPVGRNSNSMTVLTSKFQIGHKSLLRQGLSEPEFYGDLVYTLKRIAGSNNFSAQFIKIISHKKDWL